jgi:hypothetical protein
MIAHIGGVPFEELLPVLPSAGAGLLLARARLSLRLRRRFPRMGDRGRADPPTRGLGARRGVRHLSGR